MCVCMSESMSVCGGECECVCVCECVCGSECVCVRMHI